MSNSRQLARASTQRPTVRSLGLRLPHSYRISEHKHPWGQLIYASHGMMSVQAISKQCDKRWVVPPARAVWAPAGVMHRIETIGETWMRTVYIRPEFAEALPSCIRVLDVTPLLRELLLEAIRIGTLIEGHQTHGALATMLCNQISMARDIGLALLLPTEARARVVAERVLTLLDGDDSLDKLTRGAGLSPRTAERLFRKETGLSFGRWRQQARLQHAVRRLAEGNSVTAVALDCGYSSVSAFVAMFKLALGETPGQYQSRSVVNSITSAV